MDRVHEIRIAGERLEQRGGVRLKHRDQPLPQCIQRGKRLPGNRGLDRLPHPFAWINLGAIRRLKDQNDIRGQHERLGGMTARVIHQKYMQMVWVSPRKLVEEPLHHRGI